MSSKYYITTPIFYANDLPHIGHLCTTTIADCLARYNRIKLGNKNVFFTTGLDEHGTTVEQAAQKQGITNYQDFVDQKAKFWGQVFNELNISSDYFVRTTNPKHKKFVQKFLRKLIVKGDIYKDKYLGKYCNGCEKFLTLSDLNEDGLCPLHRTDQVIEIEEENYYFKLSKYSTQVKELIKNGTIKIRPKNKQNEILARINAGVENQSISRPKEKVSWGIEFPDDPDQTIYVWFEALLNYLSSLEINSKIEFWNYAVHTLGKEINWFHNYIWPAMLIAADFPAHKGAFVHSFINIGGKKISKSLGNVISPHDLNNKYQIDGTRYLLLTNLPYHKDVDITWEVLDNKYNADLANGLGNLIARVAKLCEKSQLEFPANKSKLTFPKQIDNFLSEYRFDEALKYIWEQQIKSADQYISQQKPWKLTGKQLGKVLYQLVRNIRQIAYQLQPFLPQTSEKINQQFKGPKIKSTPPLFPRI